MNKIFGTITKNTRYWIYLFLSSVFLIWILQQIFFSKSETENISAFSHQKEGNKAFFQYLEEKNISKEVLYEPAYIWVKEMLDISENTKHWQRSKKLKYVFLEKEKSFLWSPSEMKWFKKWIEYGNELIIFTLDPLVYWEMLMLPSDFEDMEKKKKAWHHFPTGFRMSIKKIMKDFLYKDSSPASIPDRPDRKEAKAQRCYNTAENKNYNLVSSSPFLDDPFENKIRGTGWELITECSNASQILAQKWKYKRGAITFVFSTDMINNEYIALADNILFLRDIMTLSAKDKVIWDVFHQGVFKKPNLWYYLFYTVPGNIFLWVLNGIFIYLWYKNTKIRKYPLPEKSRGIIGASLIYFDSLATKFSQRQIIQDTYKTLSDYLTKKGSKKLPPAEKTSLKEKKNEIYNYFK